MLLQFFILTTSIAQVPIQKDGNGNILNLGDMKSMNTMYEIQMDGLDKGAKRMPYSQISGSPFWKDIWMPATIYNGSNTYLGKVEVKLNLATHTFYYHGKNQTELVASPEIARRIVIYNPQDTTAVLAVFDNTMDEVVPGSKSGDYYIQELNQGEYQFSKMTKKPVLSADSLFGTMKRYFFGTTTKYFIKTKGMLKPIKKMRKEAILQLLPQGSACEEWLKANDIDWKKEEDVLRFFTYYNKEHVK
jgi:hypothetical protein